MTKFLSNATQDNARRVVLGDLTACIRQVQTDRVRQENDTYIVAQIRDLQKRKDAGETFYGLADLEQHVKNLGKSKKL